MRNVTVGTTYLISFFLFLGAKSLWANPTCSQNPRQLVEEYLENNILCADAEAHRFVFGTCLIGSMYEVKCILSTLESDEGELEDGDVEDPAEEEG